MNKFPLASKEETLVAVKVYNDGKCAYLMYSCSTSCKIIKMKMFLDSKKLWVYSCCNYHYDSYQGSTDDLKEIDLELFNKYLNHILL